MEIKNVYIIGRVVGSYRTQNLVKFLLDHDKQVYFDSTKTNFFLGKTGFKRLFRLFFRSLEISIKTFPKLYNLLIADVVILPAMCNNSQFELFFANLFVGVQRI